MLLQVLIAFLLHYCSTPPVNRNHPNPLIYREGLLDRIPILSSRDRTRSRLFHIVRSYNVAVPFF